MAVVNRGGPVSITNNSLASGGSLTIKTVKGGIASLAITDGGTGYAVGEVLTITQTGGSSGKVTVVTADGGVVSEVSLLNAGTGYTAAAGLATTGSTNNDCTLEIVSITPDPRRVTIHSIDCSLIADAGGVQCGFVTLRDGTTEIWTGYVHGTVNAILQGITKSFPLGITFTPIVDVNVLYTAVTDATAAFVAVAWST